MFVLAVLMAACGTAAPEDPGPKVTPPPGARAADRLGPLEAELRLLAPAGYVPDVTTFGCDVDVTEVDSSDEVVRRLSSGRFDGALGTGDATVRLIAAGAIAPVNTGLIPNYEAVYEGLKLRPFNSVGGQMFAVPVGRATNLLAWRRNAIPGTLASLGAILDPPQAASLGEQIAVPDDPASIGEAALWVARKRDDLEITDPYELDRRQFDAVMEILRLQRPYVAEYWSDPGRVREAFRSGRVSAGMATQRIVGELLARPGSLGPVGATRPREGATGISPAWMVSSDAKHPNCMYAWMNEALDPQVNAEVARAVAIAPANRESCEQIPDHCELYRADDDAYYRRVLFRTHPSADCGDERGRVCMDWEKWVQAWEELRSGN